MLFGRERFDEVLITGLREFSMTLGVLAKIDDDTYELVAVQSNSGAYVRGEKYSLGESLCKQIMTTEEVVAEANIDASSATPGHPLYRSLPLEGFIGAPVYLHGKLWGSLDFSSLVHHDQAFSKKQLKLISSLAQDMSDLISSSGDETTD